jgi:hypothetical protein
MNLKELGKAAEGREDNLKGALLKQEETIRGLEDRMEKMREGEEVMAKERERQAIADKAAINELQVQVKR